MRRFNLSTVFAALALLVSAGAAEAQQATEQYIPIGRSPGISGSYSYIGTLQQVDARNRTITVAGDQGPRTIKVPESAKIWVDVSARRESNRVGSFADLQPGRRIEIKYTNYETKNEADWIKVELRS